MVQVKLGWLNVKDLIIGFRSTSKHDFLRLKRMRKTKDAPSVSKVLGYYICNIARGIQAYSQPAVVMTS